MCQIMKTSRSSSVSTNVRGNSLSPTPPFTFVGVDTVGPWSVVARRTRGGLSHCKRWDIIFTCSANGDIHIEVIENVSSFAFINAFRRFIAIRGNIKEIRFDRRTHFVGTRDVLDIHVVNVEDNPINYFLLTETGRKHLTGDLLFTLMAEVNAIVNRRPIVNVSNDSDLNKILSQSSILTSKDELSENAFSQLDFKDMYKAQWKSAQSLSVTFWNRWRIE